VSDDYESVIKRLDNIEAVIRNAFQAGQAYQQMLDGAVPLNEGPPNEDAYVQKVRQQVLMTVIVQLGEKALAHNHPTLHESLLHKEAEASVRLDGETHVVEDTNNG
jgi:hypothetical protein